MVVSLQITKFKIRKYQPRALSPNLMLTKVSAIRYHSFAKEGPLWNVYPSPSLALISF